jgi:hypothetical protein
MAPLPSGEVQIAKIEDVIAARDPTGETQQRLLPET